MSRQISHNGALMLPRTQTATPSVSFAGFLAIAFGDVDVDEGGKTNAQKLEFICEKVASSLADSALHQAGMQSMGARTAMCDAIDAKAGISLVWIGCA